MIAQRRSIAGKEPHERTMSHDYDNDFTGWAESQAAILRSVPQGLLGLDTDNLAEEIADLGRSEVRETSSLLRQVLVHLIKLAVQPEAEAADHWIDEIMAFQGDAVLACSPGIQQRIDLTRIWKLACNGAIRSLERHGRRSVHLPDACPFSLDELLRTDLDPIAAADKIRAAMMVRPLPS